ncbi:MAG: phage/plasmid primase, P4 family [Actinobacteria bacterium]|nr:phage/plasmid primase, P4 family [Actinomycetota bacterium]
MEVLSNAGDRMSSAKAAARYIEQGWAPIPVPAGEKSPGRDSWQDLRIGLEDIPRYFTNGQNVGLHCGEPSGWLICADLDVREALEIASRFLPPTLASGRESTPESHRWFTCEGAKHTTFTDLDNSMILELRSTGHHTLVPPSTHPSGEQYQWTRNGHAPAKLGPEDLLIRCRELATAALIARRMPKTRAEGGGGRHELALAITGFLLRRGLSEERVQKILKAGWDAKGYGGSEKARREAHRDLEGIVADTSERLRDNKPATGGKRLEELVAGLRGRIAKYWDWSGRLDDETAETFNTTDLGNSRRLVAWEGGDLRYCYPWGRWLVWTGRNWLVDDRGEVLKRAKATVSRIYQEAAAARDEETRKALAKHAMSSESERKIKAMVELAKPEVSILPEELDADPWKLNVLNGTIDLRSGKLLEHNRADLVTKIAPVEYGPMAAAPHWEEVLERVLPSEDVRGFFKRLCGYALTGDVSEHVLPVLYGTGANGKSTVLNALLEALGDYGIQAAPDLLISKRGAHPTELADLFGMRLVASIEVEDGRRFAESLVKQLTGGDRVRARRMRQDFWEFDPTHTVFLATNHKPEVRGTDNAIWRRIRLIPFTETIPPEEQDKKLPEKLRAELPGILAWTVEGCLEWRLDGLRAPEEVRQATGEYREEMDVLGAFLDECCKLGPEENVSARELYEAYAQWCTDTGEQQETQRKFGRRLTERGVFIRYKGGTSGGHRWRGVDLLTLWKSRISRDSDPTDAKVTIPGSKKPSRRENSKSGSDGSDGSAGPASFDLQPGESASVEEQRDRRRHGAGQEEAGPNEDELQGRVRQALEYGNAPKKALEHYRNGDQDIESVVKSVMHYYAQGQDDPERWRAPVNAVIAVIADMPSSDGEYVEVLEKLSEPSEPSGEDVEEDDEVEFGLRRALPC